MDPLQFKPIVMIDGEDCSEQVESLTYIDEADGASDSVSIMMSDIEGKWHGDRMPNKAVEIVAKIKRTGGDENEKVFKCGKFHLDEMEFQGFPSTATFEAVSDPVSYAFKSTKRSRVWKNTDFRRIASDISERYKGLKIVYEGESIPITSIEQSRQTDSGFLKQLADKYGFGVKIYANRVILYSVEEYEKKKPVKSIDLKQMEPGWTYRSTINGNYTGVKLTCKKSDGKTIAAQHGTSKRLLTLSERAENKADAERIALARVNKANIETTTLRFTLSSPDFLVATSCIMVTGLGKLNGKYFIARVRHTLAGGYKVQVECRKITKRIK